MSEENLNSQEADIDHIAEQAKQWLLSENQTLVTVESCTGGGIAQAITRIPGSSSVFERGFVTYSNESKQQMVNVPEDMIDQFGAVSEAVAAAMASGGLQNSDGTICLSVTGIAGPDGGTADKPVGTVCFGYARDDIVKTWTSQFSGTREQVRQKSIIFALQTCLKNKTG